MTFNFCANKSVESFEDDQVKPLDWRDRPHKLKKSILNSWKCLNARSTSRWELNGEVEQPYRLCEIDEYKLIKTQILKNTARKIFYVLDIGAGNFGFGRGLAKFLNNSIDIPDGIQVHIISVRGERNLNPAVIIDGICVSHEIGGFQVENLEDELKRCNFNLDQKLDAIVSKDTFRHLIDQIGTFSQAYNLLRPDTGLLLVNNDFDYMLDSTNLNCTNRNYERRTEKLLKLTKAPFVEGINGFILRRPDSQECRLPLSYVDVTEDLLMKEGQGTDLITIFHKHTRENKLKTKTSKNNLSDKKTFELVTGFSADGIVTTSKSHIVNDNIVANNNKESQTIRHFRKHITQLPKLDNDFDISDEAHEKILYEMVAYMNSRTTTKKEGFEFNWSTQNFRDIQLTNKKLVIASEFLQYADSKRSYLKLMAMVKDFIDLDKGLEEEHKKNYTIFTKSGLLKSLINIQSILHQESRNHYELSCISLDLI